MRLTNDIRGQIVNNLVLYGFDDPVRALRVNMNVFMLICYEAMFTPDEKKLLEQIPDNWKYRGSDFYIAIGDKTSSDNWGFNRIPYGWSGCHDSPLLDLGEIEGDRPTVMLPRTNGPVKVIQDDELRKERLRLRDRWNNLAIDVREAREKAVATINAFGTVQKLVAGWPEIEPFIPAGRVRASLPAVHTEAVNRIFKLPVPGQVVAA